MRNDVIIMIKHICEFDPLKVENELKDLQDLYRYHLSDTL